MSNLKVALVGCGKIGQKHLQALIHSQSAQLIATVDTDGEKAAAAAVAFDAASYITLEDLVRHETPDALIVATPSGTHRALTQYALEQGLHVMVEKPMALEVRDAVAMVDMAAKHGRILTVTQFNRLLPTVSLARDVYHSGRLGRLIEGGISVRWARPQSYYDAAWWRGTRDMDGGVLFNQAIHALDVLLQFSGPVVEVFAFSGTQTHQIEAEDTVAAVMHTADGAFLTVNATTSVADTNLEERIVLVGDEGSIVIGPSVQQLEFWRVPGDDEEGVKREISQAPARSGWQSHAEALSDFVRAIRGTAPSALSAASAIHVIEVIEAMMRSAAEHRPIRLAEEGLHE